MSTRLGIIRHGYAQPLFRGLKTAESGSPFRFEIIQDAASRLVLKLLQDELEGAFLSPIEYAKYHNKLNIVSGVCISSAGESGIIKIHFKDNLRNLESLAFNPEATSEVVLTKMILAEKYDLSPELVAVQNLTPETLQKRDSILVVGDDCALWEDHESKLDLVDEWFDVTELPYIHGFWVTKEGKLSPEELQFLSSCIEPTDDLLEISYALDDVSVTSLQEYYRMAFYYGILKEIPELQFSVR